MKVEIWSDVVCPWCYIGKRHFEQALARFEHRDEVEVVWRSYELDPTAPPVREGTTADYLSAKYGWSKEQVDQAHERVEGIAAQSGLEYHLDSTRGGNSFDAHRLLHLAAEYGKQDELKEALLRAYFTDNEAVGDPVALTKVALATGLDEAEVTETLASDRFADAVRDDEQRARLLGISGVPFFAIDEAYGVSGAQPAEHILGALEHAWNARAAA